MTWSETWDRFVAAPRTLGPTAGAREAWHRGRARYAVWLLRVDDPAVLDRRDRVAAALPEARRVAEAHVTLFVAGFPASERIHDDDVPEAALRATASALEAARPEAVPLLVGGANAFATCAILEVADPTGRLAALRALLGAQGPEVRFAPFQPHVTAAVFTSTEPTASAVRALAPLRGLAALPLLVSAVELVEFDTMELAPRLETRWRIELRRT